MNATNVGNKFDSPCEDNVAFTVAKNQFGRSSPGGIALVMESPTGSPINGTAISSAAGQEYTVQDFNAEFNRGGAVFTALPSSRAMHRPVYPEVLTSGKSESIDFSLTPYNGAQIQSAMLRIKVVNVKSDILLGASGSYSYPDVSNSPDFTVVWDAREEGGYNMNSGGGPEPVESIIFNTPISTITPGHVTFIKYQFVAKYEGGESETNEVSFALQNFHQLLPNFPAPIYAQGSLDLIDVLFIPAKDHDQTGFLDSAILTEFRETCGYLIADVLFKEPVINFYGKEFNFWINNIEGTARDYRYCGNECSHEGPGNLGTTIRQEIELKALVHKTYQQDFTDEKDLFSVSMENIDQYNYFLHELGHAAFDLADEYKDGWHHEEREKNFPNNWRRIRSAKADAVLRHKQPEDARRIR